VAFELVQIEQATRLRLICVVRADFLQDVSEFKRARCIQSWQYFIQPSLKQYL
jgi:hypothetical protein